MKKWLIVVLLCLLPFSLAGAEPFLSTEGPIMSRNDVLHVIVVNEWTIYVDPATPITDEKGRSWKFHHLRPGQWVFVEAEPDETSRIVTQRILIRKK